MVSSFMGPGEAAVSSAHQADMILEVDLTYLIRYEPYMHACMQLISSYPYL